jgi:uncharacterized protein (TIGR00255 family)
MSPVDAHVSSRQVYSMTGYGRAQVASESAEFEIELKSVNHRYFDSALRLPRGFATLEADLRQQLQSSLQRGRVELSVQRRVGQGKRALQATLQFDRPLFNALYQVYEEALQAAPSPKQSKAAKRGKAKRHKRDKEIVLRVLAREGVLSFEQPTEASEQELELLRQGVRQALDGLLKMRSQEGARLWSDIVQRMREIERIVVQLSERIALAPERMLVQMKERLSKLLNEPALDPQRLAMEAALLVDRADVTEELVRLKSHLQMFWQESSECHGGRKLEFLLQEFGREFNTLSTKSQDAQISAQVLEAKVLLEKIREQTQNIV